MSGSRKNLYLALCSISSLSLIAAIREAPPEYASAIAEPLVYLEDAQAQDAFERYTPREEATMARESKAKGMGVFSW